MNTKPRSTVDDCGPASDRTTTCDLTDCDATDCDATDRDLITRAQLGDANGFTTLVVRYRHRLFQSMTNLVGSPTLAEDLVQDALVKAFCNIKNFRGESEFFSWLYRIAMNCRRDYQTPGARVVSGDEVLYRIDAATKSSDGPSSRMELAEQRDWVRAALDRLAPHHRNILLLREYECFDYETIGKILSLNLGTVRSRLSRARAQLRRELKSLP